MNHPIELQLSTANPDIQQLCHRYWAMHNGRFVVSLADLSRDARCPWRELETLVFASCNAVCRDDVCVSCSAHYVYADRAEFADRRQRRNAGYVWQCPSCEAAAREHAVAMQRPEAEQRQRMVAKHYEVQMHTHTLSDLTLRDAVFLITLMRHVGEEDAITMRPLHSEYGCATPSHTMTEEMVRHVYKRGLIAVDPRSSPDAFGWTDAGVPATLYPFRAHWTLTTNPSLIPAIAYALRERQWIPTWHDEVVELWHQIALHECIAYLTHALAEHHLPFTPGVKTMHLFQDILTRYTVSQVYSFIWRAAKDAAAFYVREQVTRLHAANTVISGIQYRAERAYANGWDVTGYRRHRDLPASTLSQVWFNRVLLVGDNGITTLPSWDRNRMAPVACTPPI